MHAADNLAVTDKLQTCRPKPLITISHLSVQFRTSRGVAKAVNDISFTIHEGERVAIVGESGCGKSATLLAMQCLLPTPPAEITSGQVFLDDRDILTMSGKELRDVLGNEISMVFQDALSSFSPVATVGKQIVDGIRRHQGLSKKAAHTRAIEMLTRVGIPDPVARADQYPHQLSGGMRQRAMIAMALVGTPRLLIADEPTTALDVTVQAQVLEMVRGLEGSSILWVSHDLGVVAGLAERVIVMYAGSIVEEGTVRDIFHDAQHPYTRGLLNSVPKFQEPERRELYAIPGLPPDLTQLPAGCPFYDRCDVRENACIATKPILDSVSDGHRVACLVTTKQNEKALVSS
ncbi:ABC transporter ATP-binding protein [Rhodococcus sp. NPDC060176]|uniref:ABC transporter ATP-binding protein n=1 Tax=Rhodococcus sp. NPDC060176 TaxID=3347062 RepID=UPI003658B514